MNIIAQAIEELGEKPVAAACGGMTYQAVKKWRVAGRLPRTEFTGETSYAKHIERLSRGKFKARDLLAASQQRWAA